MDEPILTRTTDREETSFRLKKGEPYWIVHQTKRHTYLRLDEQDYFLWSRLDGTRTITALVIEYMGVYHASPFSRLDTLLSRLHENGLLASSPSDPSDDPDHTQNRYIMNGFWEILFPIRNIDQVFLEMFRYTGWIFRTPGIMYGLILFCVAGFLYFIVTEPLPSYPLLLEGDSHVSTLFWTYVTILASAFLHEGGHALACKAYGRKINNAGLVLYYGSPCLYVDTTDIWMAPPQARILVSLAGPAVNIFIGSLCSLTVCIFPMIEYSTFIWRFAFISYCIALINLNPLLEFDGYYALSDLLEIPNLRSRAFSYIRSLSLVRIQRGEEKIDRTGWIYLMYGMLGGIFTLFTILVTLYIWEAHVADLADELLNKKYELDHIVSSLIIVVLLLPFIAGMIFQGYQYLKNRLGSRM